MILNKAVSGCRVMYPRKRNIRMLEAVDVNQKASPSQNISTETSRKNSEQALASNQFGGIPVPCRCFPSLMKDGVIKYLATGSLETDSTIDNIRKVTVYCCSVVVFYERSVFATPAYLWHVIRVYADNFHITKLITSACKPNSEVTAFILNEFSVLFHFS